MMFLILLIYTFGRFFVCFFFALCFIYKYSKVGKRGGERINGWREKIMREKLGKE